MTCSFEGCDRTAKARGLCDGHWQQDKAGKTLTPLNAKAPNGQAKTPRTRTTLATEIRAWAVANGIDVPAKGPVPANVKEDWRRATEQAL